MTRFRYTCQSKSGYTQGGEGTTELKLGSEEHATHLLHEIARIATQAEAPWDPFNVHLVVWAHNEPKPFPQKFSSFEDLIKFLQTNGND